MFKGRAGLLSSSGPQTVCISDIVPLTKTIVMRVADVCKLYSHNYTTNDIITAICMALSSLAFQPEK